MTKADMHYLNCDDRDCEKVACVARRDYERKISELENAINKCKELIAEADEAIQMDGQCGMTELFKFKKEIKNLCSPTPPPAKEGDR